MMEEKTIFERILDKEIPCNLVYEDEFTLAFDDINPQAPVHVLVIPKKKIINVAHAQDEDALLLGKLLITSKHVAALKKVENSGYRIVFNTGAGAGQSVFYLHCHVIGGRELSWPPG